MTYFDSCLVPGAVVGHEQLDPSAENKGASERVKRTEVTAGNSGRVAMMWDDSKLSWSLQ